MSPGNLGPSALDVLLLVEFKFYNFKKNFLNILLNAYWQLFLRGWGGCSVRSLARAYSFAFIVVQCGVFVIGAGQCGEILVVDGEVLCLFS